MTLREIKRIHRSTLTAEHREELLIEAIGRMRRIINAAKTIADINSDSCEDEWMAIAHSLAFADTYIDEVLKDNEERKQEEIEGRHEMSANEIRRLTESHVLVNFCGKEHLDGEPCTECFDNSEHTCQDNEAIKAALLSYAAMVERCEESLKCNFVAQDGRTTINSAVKAQVSYILKGATDERK